MKLIKFIASSTSYSRRKSEKLIKNSNVKVNGKTISNFTQNIDPKRDTVKVNGKIITKNKTKFFKFYKPKGYVCSKDDEYSKTIYDYIGKKYLKYTYVGRLDKDSSGLLLLTNDGDLIYKLTHPSYEVQREYLVSTKCRLTDHQINRILKGIQDNNDYLRCDEVVKNSKKEYKLILHTGRKREVKRLIGYFNNEVEKLKRISYGPISLKGLNEGEIKELNKKEVKLLKEI